MAFDLGLAERLRECLADEMVVEKKMFGGLAMMCRGHMTVGIVGDTLMVRVGPEAYAAALAKPHAREMKFTGKALKGFVYVDPPGFARDADLAAWVALALAFTRALPAK